MKQDYNVSKQLRILIKKTPGKSTSNASSQCEVVGFSSPKGKSSRVSLPKDLKDYQKLVDRLSSNKELPTSNGDSCLVRYAGHRGATHVLFVNLGEDKTGINMMGPAERLRQLGSRIAKKLRAERLKTAQVLVDTFLNSSAKLNIDPAVGSYALTEGMALALYKFSKYRTKKVTPYQAELTLFTNTQGKVRKLCQGAEMAQAFIAGAVVCKNLANEPSNNLYPEALAKEVKKLADENKLKITVLNESALKKEKMGLLLGVGQGSTRPPRLIALEYNPSGSKAKGKKRRGKTVCLVGKGITFDSGGISIKPSVGMGSMIYDMCGAATVIGAIVTCARLKIKTRVITIVAAAENMPDGNAIRPGDILRSRSGKTVEIANTDAEGRLVLADALDYAQDMDPDCIVNVATLTGAAIITLGSAAAPILGNDAGLIRALKSSSKNTGERVWELPLYDHYAENMKSEYADICNIGTNREAGTAKGAIFLQSFIRKGVKWAHMDIASVSDAVSSAPYYHPKMSTAFGVRLLVDLAQNFK